MPPPPPAPLPWAYVPAVYAAFALVAAAIGLAADRGRAAGRATRDPGAGDGHGVGIDDGVGDGVVIDDGVGDGGPDGQAGLQANVHTGVQADGASTRRKLPGYVALNLAILALLAWPAARPAVPVLLAALGAGLADELAGALGATRLGRAGCALLAAGGVGLAALAAAEAGAPVAGLRAMATAAWSAALLAGVVGASLGAPPGGLGRRLLALGAAGVLIPGGLGAWLLLWARSPGGAAAAFVYLATAAHDAYAQVVGQALGRRPLLPRVSPAKTVEGAAAGLAAAAAMGACLAPTIGLAAPAGAALGLACGAAAAAGDLTASSWKRALGLRDFGRALGPHGGLLDRFDGLLAAAALAWALIRPR